MNNDLIKRNLAIAYAKSGLVRRIDGEDWIRVSEVAQSLKDAPTVEERTQGEWKLHGMIYYCSVCGHDYEQGGNNFCGNCGADMRGGAE